MGGKEWEEGNRWKGVGGGKWVERSWRREIGGKELEDGKEEWKEGNGWKGVGGGSAIKYHVWLLSPA